MLFVAFRFEISFKRFVGDGVKVGVGVVGDVVE